MALTDTLTNIANTIRSYTKKEDKMTLWEMPAEIYEVFALGNDDFWHRYTQKAINDRYMFSSPHWTDETFTIPFCYTVGHDNRFMFQTSLISELTETQMDFSKAELLRQTFAGSSFVRMSVNGESCDHWQLTFESCEKLETLYITVKSDAVYTNTFSGCSALKDFRITGSIGNKGFDISESTLLSLDSIKSILSACNLKGINTTITLPYYCVDGETITEDAINNNSELKALLDKATNTEEGYTYNFAFN